MVEIINDRKEIDVIQENVTEDEPKIFIGCQPIFNSKLEVAGYELLFRSGAVNAFDGCDDGIATSQVINNALLEIGLDEIVGDVPAYINFTKELIINGVAQLLPADRVVLEILETVKVDQELIEGVKLLVEAGYKIALDDFTYSKEWDPLIKLAHIIKIDVMQHPVDKIREQLKHLEGSKVKFLAEKIETQDEYEQLREEGFDYFQGYFFAKPTIVSQKAMSAENISLIQLIAQLQSPDAEIDEIEKLVSQNVSLSYKLLRYINSAAFALNNKLTSIKQIVIYFGIQRLKDWVCLIALTGNKNKPAELIHTGLVRAKMCELIAEEIGADEKNTYFIVGLFSILDVLLDQSLATILENLPLDTSINQALLELEGDMGKALQCSISCEQCIWDKIKFPEISIARLSELHMEATVWSRQSLSELN
jgi:c-di-GMP-related signal transduction protein